jgi:hypothetical protein
MFRVIGGLTPSSAYAVTVRATTKDGQAEPAGRRAADGLRPAAARRKQGPGQAVSAAKRGTHASS